MSLLELQSYWNGIAFCRLNNGSIVGIIPFIFTHAIVSNITQDFYEDRWCYKTLCEAKGALKDWVSNQDVIEEPTGWHRHPPTGRRVFENHCEVYP